MIILTGSNLNKRHEELNAKVNDAAKKNLNLDEIEETNETADVDKLFKIDLASKYKNIDYILEVIKSGDSLHISRALGCDWIGDDEFSQFMNTQYLDVNMFPSMSPKMKKKLLATLSARIRNGERAEEFHHYCMRNRMYKLGMDFLLYTNESFKIEILTLHPHVYNDFDRNPKYLEHFIGNSFLLAEYYLKVVPNSSRSMVLYKLRYLYSVSQDKYLDLLETFRSVDNIFHVTSLRLSQSIMKKHKNRVLKDPWLYLNTLIHDVVTKYSTSDDAKVYAKPFLRDKHFWDSNYYIQNEYFLKLIPLGERFSFIKKIVRDKYPNELFETHINFYNNQCYKMMTPQEKEAWALYHVGTGQELHGCDNDYIWYQFINFKLAFIALKKYILVAPDNDKRAKILETLINSAKTQEELTVLLEYYYNRHGNELREYKRNFLDELLWKHKILNFNDKCWAALEKMFFSIEVYYKLSEDLYDFQNNKYRELSLIYYIIHEKPIPEVFYDFVIKFNITSCVLRWSYNDDLDAKKLDMIYEYMLQCYTKHVQSLIETNYHDKKKLREFLGHILTLNIDFEKTLEDVPKNINDLVMQNYEALKNHRFFTRFLKPPPTFRISNIMHYLKEDAMVVVKNFHEIKEYFQNAHCKNKNNINWLIRKLKIYFHHDIAPEYVKMLSECLSVEELPLQTARVVAFGIFYLSDEEYKVDFLNKHAPVDMKIDHVNISRNLLAIQAAICSVACQSRPPLPLSSIRDYIKGDYLQHCLPIFDSYLANLTPTQCLSFVESLLDSPVSVQKHGLRLAFQCFSPENLKNLVLNVWKKMKNVSLRKVLYTALFEKVAYYHDNLPAQWELFGALNIITENLNQDDDEGIFELLVKDLPPHVMGQHLQSAYIVVNTFPKRTINYQRLARIVQAIENNLESISKSILLAIMEDHINAMLDQNLILNTVHYTNDNELVNAKWSLIKTVIIKHQNIHIVHLLSDKFLKNWYKTNDNEYIYRRFWTQFVNDLETLSYREETSKYIDINNIFITILARIESALPFKEVYISVLELIIGITARQVLSESGLDKDHDIETKDVLIKKTLIKFSELVADALKKHVDEGTFYQSFSQAIQTVLNDVIYKVVAYLNAVANSPYAEISLADVKVLLCSVLTEHAVRKMYLFVVDFLPQGYCGKYNAVYFDVIDKLKSFDDEEIQHFICLKFYSSDFVYRDFMP